MQLANLSEETVPEAPEIQKKIEGEQSLTRTDDCGNTYDDLVVDVSGRSFEFPVLENALEHTTAGGLYLYKNVYSLIPKSSVKLGSLKTLKFFGNELNLFPSEFRSFTGLECLQMKISSPGFGGLPLHKLKGLKELELSKLPSRPSAFQILSDIVGLKCLTKLSVCHFGIRYLPPEIGCLKNLEYLDLSFNKIKTLPCEIGCLTALMLLKVTYNKLVELPSALSYLTRLQCLDLSNNRLTSLASLDLSMMHNLQSLNLQYNKLLSALQIPSWISCSMAGNAVHLHTDDISSTSVEMEVYEGNWHEDDRSPSHKGPQCLSSNLLTSNSSSSRCFGARRSGRRWKRQNYLQQKARQERLNNSRKWKGMDHTELLTANCGVICKLGDNALTTETCSQAATGIVNKDANDRRILLGESEDNKLHDDVAGDRLLQNGTSIEAEICSCTTLETTLPSKYERQAIVASPDSGEVEHDEGSWDVLKCSSKPKRNYERDLDNPKACKFRRPVDEISVLSCKYSKVSFCGTEDHLPDGFYDAGRDRPFVPLENYEQNQCLSAREVILLDRKRDEELDAITLSAQALVKHMNELTRCCNQASVCDLQIAIFLAFFVSDHFGGSDQSGVIEKTRKSVSGSNYQKPFICTCSTGSNDGSDGNGFFPKEVIKSVDDILSDICEKSLHSIKNRQKSIIVPIGAIRYGICRHRALLMKYLCDRMEPSIPCELVRGYLDFMPHAWNVVLIQKGNKLVRMIVDACHPHDIREETDPEYFCRYIPLTRCKVSLSTSSDAGPGFPFLLASSSEEIEKAPSSTLVRSRLGSLEVAAKVRTLEADGSSANEIRNFEYNCLGEVRILSALRHPCIVELYGHHLSCKWTPLVDEHQDHRTLQSAILMEYVKGGSLKSYLEKLLKEGEKHAPLELAMSVARDVSCALAELHSKHVMHRDVKSENILIDLDNRRDDGTPIVKLCDFDRAVPLRSMLHTCCIAHKGVPPADVCVGTPRWMAPEVMRAMYKPNAYGVEVDIWSYGCLILELLTLKVPYSGLSESHIHDHLQKGKRPQLTDELEALDSFAQSTKSPSSNYQEPSDVEIMKFLVDLFHKCTEPIPTKRPRAQDIYDMVVAQTICCAGSSTE